MYIYMTGMTVLISLSDRDALYCVSDDLIESIITSSGFCVFTGKQHLPMWLHCIYVPALHICGCTAYVAALHICGCTAYVRGCTAYMWLHCIYVAALHMWLLHNVTDSVAHACILV